MELFLRKQFTGFSKKAPLQMWVIDWVHYRLYYRLDSKFASENIIQKCKLQMLMGISIPSESNKDKSFVKE